MQIEALLVRPNDTLLDTVKAMDRAHHMGLALVLDAASQLTLDGAR